MELYILSVLLIAVVGSCFYNKNAYQKRYNILGISLIVAFVPLLIGNFVAASKCEREIRIISQENLLVRDFYVDSLSNDTSEIFISFKDSSATFIPWGSGNISISPNLEIHYIDVDSTNVPRYEVTKEFITDRGWYYSKMGIPPKNKKKHIYIPNDINKQKLIAYINGKEKE
jgi:hypothetical protein